MRRGLDVSTVRTVVAQAWSPMRSDSTIHWSAYPALLLSAVFAGGILLEGAVGRASLFEWGMGVVGAGLISAAAEWRARRRLVSLAPLARVAAIGLMVLCAGGVRHADYRVSSPRALARVATAVQETEREATVVGRIQTAPERAEDATRFTIDVDSVRGSPFSIGVDGQARVTLRPSPWEDSPDPFPTVYQGDRVRLRGQLQSAPGQRNPGGFDYAAYLSRRGTCCTMYVGTPDAIVVAERNPGLVTTVVTKARQYVRGQIARYVPSEDGRAVLRALLLGDRSRITDAQRDRFAQTGLMHLLAVSGLHVFLVGMVLYMLLRPLLMRLRLEWQAVEIGRAALTIVVLCLYMMLTGARPSVVRAVIMSSLFIGGILFQRSSYPLNTLGVAALVLLAVRPPALFDVGFQLSMAAVAALLGVHPRLMEWVPESWVESDGKEWLVSTVSASAAATVGTAPVLLLHFGWVSGAGLLLNVVGIPVTGLGLSAAVGMLVLGGPWSVAGAAFGSVADVFVQGLLLTSREGVEWLGWMGVRMGEPNLWVLGALVAGTVALAQWPRPRHRWRCVVCGLFLLGGSVWTSVFGPGAEPTLNVLFFDVGQGDAILVTAPDDRRMLVDTGPRSSPERAAASYSILPFLERRGIDSLETVVVTHPDEDHLGGLPEILEEVSVGEVLHSGQEVETSLYRRTRRLFRRREISHRSVQRGEVFTLGSSVQVRVLGPPSRPSRRGIESENGQSVVLHLAYGGTDALLSGDVEESAERDLIRSYGSQLESWIVKVPHHGSETSSSQAFVDRVVGAPERTNAVVSVGRSNQFGMPSAAVLRRWDAEGAQVWTTARHGAVWLRSNGDEIWKRQWNQ